VPKVGNTKDYSKVESANEDLVTYTSVGRSTGYKRGVLSSDALRKARVIGYKYISTIQIQEQIGFALLNLTLKSGDDVRELKKLYDESKKEFDTETTADMREIITIQPPIESLLPTEGSLPTGGSTDYENLYRQEKRRYLQLKEIAKKITNVQPPTQPPVKSLLPTEGLLPTGGSIDYENLYRQEKRRYLQLKEIASKMGIKH
jgi:hypothetical protein